MHQPKHFSLAKKLQRDFIFWGAGMHICVLKVQSLPRPSGGKDIEEKKD